VTVRARSFVVLHLLFISATPAAAAMQQYQYSVDTRPPRGLLPTADQLSSPIDTIDPVNGKLHLQVPLASLPPGPADSGFDLDLVYDSHLYDLKSHEEQALYNNPSPVIVQELQAAGSTGGWTYNFQNFRLEAETRVDLDPQCPTNGPLRVYRYRIGLPDGSQHILHLKGFSEEVPNESYDGEGWFGIAADGMPPGSDSGALQCWITQGWLASGRLTYFTSDGSYLKLEIETTAGVYWWNKTWTLYFPDGRRAEGRGSKLDALYDANSNKIVFENTCADPQCWQPRTRIYHEQDAPESRNARKIVIAFNTTAASPSDQGVNAKTDNVAGPGPNGTVTWIVNWQKIIIGDDGRRYRWGDAYMQELKSLGIVHWMVRDVVLPQAEADASALTYRFAYSQNTPAPAGFGELRTMVTPSGATYDYKYRFDGATCTDAQHCPSAADLAHYNWVNQRTIGGSDIAPLTWNYEHDLTLSNSTVHNPDGGDIVHWFASPANWGGIKLIDRIDEPHGSVRKRVWAQNKAYPLVGVAINNANNPYIERETVTVGNAASEPISTAVTSFVYDKNGNALSKTEWDWVSYAGAAVETGGSLRRLTVLTYQVATSQASATNNDPNGYWQAHNPTLWSDPLSPRRLGAIRRREIRDSAGIAAAAEFEYDGPYTKGNVKKEYHWDNTKASVSNPLTAGNSVVFSRDYDSRGNVTDIFEPDVRTHIEYDNGTVPKYTYYAYQTPSQRRTEYVWSPNGAVIIAETDLDNNTTTAYAYDNLGRQKTVLEAMLRRSAMIYDDVNRRVTTLRDLGAMGDGKLQTVSHYDVLGRMKLSQQSDGTSLASAADGIKVVTIHLQPAGSGRRVVTSSPHRSTSDPALEWTCTQYDRLGRATAVSTFKGNAAPTDCASATNRTGATTISYTASWTTMTDPASNVRSLRRDALGRTDQAIEYPSPGTTYTTSYSYDNLDNLQLVCQNGTISGETCIAGQRRTFSYSSLGRLLSSASPETNGLAATYTYYDSGQLKTRRDPRGVVTAFQYDELQRLRSKTYSNDLQNTPTATYSYYLAGSAPAGYIGQPESAKAISGAVTIASTIYDGYDRLGRVTGSSHTIEGYPDTLRLMYTYWLNNTLASTRYPSDHIVNYSVDEAGRLAKAYSSTKAYADVTVAQPPYVSYTPEGRIAQMRFGNDLWETREDRAPGTTTAITLGTTAGGNNMLQIEYNFHGTQNNGSVISHNVVRPTGSWRQSYAYDGVNRIKCAAEAVNVAPADPCTQGTWRRTFDYDAYGNRWVTSSVGFAVDSHEPIAASNFDATTNRLYVNYSGYDAAGNQTRYEPWNLFYDAENRLVSAVTTPNASDGTGRFFYDADGRRVKKVWTAGSTTHTTYYAYNAFGQLVAEYSTEPAISTGTAYIHPDMLGSVRMVTGEKPSNGTPPVLECYDYEPFGRMLSRSNNNRGNCYPTSPDSQITSRLSEKFSGKQRDRETRIDYFGARYMSAAEGRFLSPDAPLIDQDPANPQSWNLYAYVRNNPLSYIDPSGQDCIYADDFESTGMVQLQRGDCTRRRGTFVKGTIDKTSIRYNPLSEALGYSYSAESEGTIGSGVIDLSRRGGDELDAKGVAFIAAMDARGYGLNRMLAAFPVASVAGITTMAGVPYALGTTVGWGYGWVGGAGVVLGPNSMNPNYIDWAKILNANALNMPNWLWKGLNYFGQTWTANRAFLDMSIWRGQKFFVMESPNAVGSFARELQYMTRRGIGPDLWIMINR
jgi:RHS repeat-associated protein